MEESTKNSIWSRLTDRGQLSMRDRKSDEIHWRVNISQLGLIGGLLALVVIIFITLMLLMAYTPILDILPGYRTRADRMHNDLTHNIMRLDSLERHMEMIMEYNEAVTQIMSGSTPTLHSTVLTDTIRYDKSRILPTRADTLLRAALESTTGDYSLTNTKPLRSEAALFSAPMRGTITRPFDAPESSFDVAIIPIDGDSSVKAVESGTVIGIERNADAMASITIQHTDGYISIYNNLGTVLVRKGQSVQSGSVVGDLTFAEAEASNTSNLELRFELWRDGTAVDPERYILF